MQKKKKLFTKGIDYISNNLKNQFTTSKTLKAILLIFIKKFMIELFN